ncbi:anti sigma factor C-terminal domain-containing protein [Bacillus marinisedimentorum]|uniref:anti sigma factor C-terminal domain-containing protein n=1 Tax=Bacillus marinisedimentorum TaxID=1821260 RepID=UPI0007E26C44|nr:anti sigma factor C-terminal domain-containing protein [Bacillus marinisedimentorum]
MKNHNESVKEQGLNELFEDNKTSASLGSAVKKAKRRTIIRNVLISMAAVVFVFIIISFLWLFLMRSNEESAMHDMELFSRITSPNVEQLGVQSMGNGFLEGILFVDRYKEIGGIPVDWSDQVVTYSLFGGVSRLTGDHSPIQMPDKTDGRQRSYDRETKQRIMEFYHPEGEYDFIRNDMKRLNELPEDTLVEMAVSFDRMYTPDEIRSFIPDTVQLEWYWADTYTNKESFKKKEVEPGEGEEATLPATPELGSELYGFDHFSENPAKSEEIFIETIEEGLSRKDGKYHSEFERIHRHLTNNSTVLSSENVNVLGVVVSGPADELAALENLEAIRAAVLGVTADPQL